MQLQRLEMFPLSKKRADDASRHKAHNWQSGMPLSKTKVQCHGYGHMVHHSYFLSLQDRQSDQHHLEANRELLALFNFASSSCIRDTIPDLCSSRQKTLQGLICRGDRRLVEKVSNVPTSTTFSGPSHVGRRRLLL